MKSDPKLRVQSWSYSRYAEYMTCPFKLKCKVLLKLREPGNEAMDRGSDIHKKLESYLKKETKKVPIEAKLLEKEYKALRTKKIEVELSAAFDVKWNVTQWMGPTTWCRAKLDVVEVPTTASPTVSIVDHKTGKLKEQGEYEEQLELYGLTGLLLYPIADKAKSQLLFVDHGKVVEGEEYKRADIPKLQKKWELRVTPMLSDTKFKPTPNFTCKWCTFRKSNNGPCSEG